jgi:hypothetical protein
MQAPVAELDAVQLAPLQPSCEALQPTVKFSGFRRQPFLRRRGQAEFRRSGRNSGGRNR